MKKIFTQTFATLLLTALALTASQKALAQDDDMEVTGYANVYIKVTSVPEDGGQVFPFYQEATVKAWRTDWDFKQPVSVSTMMGALFSMYYLYARPSADAGYSFAGWYLDDGDGVFDMDKDQFLSDEEEYINLAELDEGTTVYATQAEARNGAYPTEPTQQVFAYFSRGARVALSFYQDDYLDLHANCGTVWISKKQNEPGDEVTVRAIANDGFHFEYWQDASQMGNIVSRQNPYTFTVQGGECLYAYFAADDSPVFDLPEEGGFAVANLNRAWVFTDESLKNGAQVLVMEPEDMKRTADGRVYLDMSNEDAQVNITQWHDAPSIIYGKGQVRFAYRLKFGVARSEDPLVRWSGTQGVSLSGDVIYVYVFIPELGAFIQYGTTDDFNPAATPAVQVPAEVAYMSISAFDLTDDQGNIPTVIGLSPETCDRGLAGRDSALEQLANISGAQLNATSLRGQRVFTLSGVEVKTTDRKGVYIVDGRKVVLSPK